jgi:uncharacterized protein YkwD/regulator of replication initiation timing
MVSFAKIFLFYAIIAILVCGVYSRREYFSGLADSGSFAGFFNEQIAAAEKKIAEAKNTANKVMEKNSNGLNLDETIPGIKKEIAGKIAPAGNGGGWKTATENEESGIASDPETALTGRAKNGDQNGLAAADPSGGGNGAKREDEEENGGLTAAGVIDLTNRERIAALGGGSELKESAELKRAAEYRMQDMFSKQYFSHESPEGLKMNYFLDKAGYDSLASGENLAEGNFTGDSELVRGWMNSPGHRVNILNDAFREIGVAVGYGMFDDRKAWVAVQLFGTPSTACYKPDADLEDRVDTLKNSLENIKNELASMSIKIDGMKDEANDLKDRIEELQAAGKKQEAVEADEALNPLIDAINEKVMVYNQKVAEEKNLYAEYRKSADEYNAQVKEYNYCLEYL